MSRILTLLTLLLEFIKWLTTELDKRELEDRKDAIRADPRGELRRMFVVTDKVPDSEAPASGGADEQGREDN